MNAKLLASPAHRLLVALLFGTIPSHAQDYQDFLARMPRVEEVQRRINGTNVHDTYVKQAGAFSQLRLMLKAIDGNRTNPLTGDERGIDDNYRIAYEALVQKAQLPASSARNYLTDEGVKSLTRYRMNKKFRSELYTIFFDNNFKDEVDPLVQEQLVFGNRTIDEVNAEGARQKAKAETAKEEEVEQANKPRRRIIRIGIGFIVFIGSLFVYVLWLDRRKFYRRNKYGIEEFPSWFSGIKTNAFELSVFFVTLFIMFIGLAIMIL